MLLTPKPPTIDTKQYDCNPFPCVWLNGETTSSLPIFDMKFKEEVSTEERLRKTFKCDMCSYTTKHQSNLAVHRRTHTGERPYWCGSCGMRYTQGHLLKSHIRSRHNAQMVYYNLDKRNELKPVKKSAKIHQNKNNLDSNDNDHCQHHNLNNNTIMNNVQNFLPTIGMPNFLPFFSFPSNANVNGTAIAHPITPPTSAILAQCEHERRLKILRRNVVKMLTVLSPNLQLENTLKHDTEQVDQLLENVLNSTLFNY